MAATLKAHLIDVDRVTGEYIQGWPRIKQSILTILTTRIKTRVMRLWWGSDFLDMQDKPNNRDTFVKGINAAAHYINLYEPEFKITSIEIRKRLPDGSVYIIVNGVDLVTNQGRRINEDL